MTSSQPQAVGGSQDIGRSRTGNTATQTQTRTPAWAVGFLALAAVLLILGGMFQFIAGLSAVLDDDFYVVTDNYTLGFDTTAWGWMHMGIGGVMALAGLFLFSGSLFARIVASVVAISSAVANFYSIPYYPVWSIVIIALCVVILWAVIAHGGRQDDVTA